MYVDTAPRGCVPGGKGPGRGAAQPRMICHCLMRLISLGWGWGSGMQGDGALIRSRWSWEWWQVGACGGLGSGVPLTRQVVSINL